MMFFFFLSGILCKRDLSLASLIKDIRFILLPYFVYGLILIIFSILRSRSFDLPLVIVQLNSLLVGKDVSIGPIWFLPALFICKQLFLLIKFTKNYSLAYVLLFILSFFPVYYISKNDLNMPFFADSALCGLPFFLLGNGSLGFIDRVRRFNSFNRLGISGLLFVLSLLLCYHNGKVSLAGCSIGNSVFAYYLNAVAAIISISIVCMSLNNFRLSFITTTSYGSIVTLGLHGIPLTIFNYYLPLLFGNEPSAYSFFWGVLYSLMTYFLCFLFIIFVDKQCPLLFGLKGLLFKM